MIVIHILDEGCGKSVSRETTGKFFNLPDSTSPTAIRPSFLDLLTILLKRNQILNRTVAEFGRVSRPRLKLPGRHFLFHIPGIVRFVRPIVRLPHGMCPASVVVPPLGSNIPAGLPRLVRQGLRTVPAVFAALKEEESPAKPAFCREPIEPQPVPEIVVQEGTQVKKLDLLAEDHLPVLSLLRLIGKAAHPAFHLLERMPLPLLKIAEHPRKRMGIRESGLAVQVPVTKGAHTFFTSRQAERSPK